MKTYCRVSFTDNSDKWYMTLNAVSLGSACRRVTDYCTENGHNAHISSASIEPTNPIAEKHHVTINNKNIMKGSPYIVKE